MYTSKKQDTVFHLYAPHGQANVAKGLEMKLGVVTYSHSISALAKGVLAREAIIKDH